MVQSSYSVVVLSINSLRLSITLLWYNVNERELLLVIHVQGKNISRKSCIHENILL